MAAIYVTGNGIVEVLSANWYGCDIEDPFYDSIFDSYIFEACEPKDESFDLLTSRTKRYIFFGVSREGDHYFIEKRRKDANYGFFYVSYQYAMGHFHTDNFYKLLKKCKRELSELLIKYEYYEKDEVFCCFKKTFTGEDIDAYFDMYGEDLDENGVFIMMDRPVGKVIYGDDEHIDDLYHKVVLTNENVFEFCEKNYVVSKIKGLEDLYEIDFGGFVDVFSKEEFIPELFARAKGTKEFRNIYNNMLLKVLYNGLEEIDS